MSDDAASSLPFKCVPSQACRRRAPGLGRSAPAARRRARGWTGTPTARSRSSSPSPRLRSRRLAPPRSAALGAALTISALVLANQLHAPDYHPIDNTGVLPRDRGWSRRRPCAVSLRARPGAIASSVCRRATAQQEIEVLAARLEEQSRIEQAVHARLAERIAAIAVHAEGAQRSPTPVRWAHRGRGPRRARPAPRALGRSTSATDLRGRYPPPALRQRLPGPTRRPSTTSRRGLGHDVVLSPLSALRSPSRASSLPPPAALSGSTSSTAAPVAAPLLVDAPTLSSRRGVQSRRPAHELLADAPVSHVTGVALLLVVFYSVGAWCRRWWWSRLALALVGALAMEAVSGLADDATPATPPGSSWS